MQPATCAQQSYIIADTVGVMTISRLAGGAHGPRDNGPSNATPAPTPVPGSERTQDTFERSRGAAELTWLPAATARYVGSNKPTTIGTYFKAAAKFVGGIASVTLTLAALAVLALIQGREDKSAESRPP